MSLLAPLIIRIKNRWILYRTFGANVCFFFVKIKANKKTGSKACFFVYHLSSYRQIAPLVLAPRVLIFVLIAPFKLAPVRSAPAKFELVKLAPFKLAL